jgi:hypothetical protein
VILAPADALLESDSSGTVHDEKPRLTLLDRGLADSTRCVTWIVSVATGPLAPAPPASGVAVGAALVAVLSGHLFLPGLALLALVCQGACTASEVATRDGRAGRRRSRGQDLGTADEVGARWDGVTEGP